MYYVLSVIGVWVFIMCVSGVITFLKFRKNPEGLLKDILGEFEHLSEDQIKDALKRVSNNEVE